MAKRTIRARLVVEDIRAGLSDEQLIQKHEITSGALHSIFRKLVQSGLMTDLEFYERSRLAESEVFRAFSEEPDVILNCPDCGQRLPEYPAQCTFCQTISTTVKASMP